MAFTSFGTGMSYAAKGMAYTPDWNAESNRIMALSTTMKEFYATKNKLAEDEATRSKQYVAPNKADQLAYDKDAIARTQRIANLKKQDPTGWRFNVDLLGKIRTEQDGFLDNPIVQKSKQFDAEKQKVLEYMAKEKGFATRKSGQDILQQMNDRAEMDPELYKQKYGTYDFVFSAPSKIDMNKEISNIMNSAFPYQYTAKKNGQFMEYKNTRGDIDPIAFGKIVDDIIANYPDEVQAYVQERAISGIKEDTWNAVATWARSSIPWDEKELKAEHIQQFDWTAQALNQAKLKRLQEEGIEGYDLAILKRKKITNNPYVPGMLPRNAPASQYGPYTYAGGLPSQIYKGGKWVNVPTDMAEDFEKFRAACPMGIGTTGNLGISTGGTSTVDWTAKINTTLDAATADEMVKIGGKLGFNIYAVSVLDPTTGKATGNKKVIGTSNVKTLIDGDGKIAYDNEEARMTKGRGFRTQDGGDDYTPATAGGGGGAAPPATSTYTATNYPEDGKNYTEAEARGIYGITQEGLYTYTVNGIDVTYKATKKTDGSFDVKKQY